MKRDKKIAYLHTCLPAAEKAGNTYDMSPVMILAQGALESGWGGSLLAREHHNYFGIMGYGASNAYWHGERATLEGANGRHYFRHYGGVESSFLDFARLIRTGYHRAWSFSRQPEAYAKEIAYSPYISEQNGDNREQYRHSLVALVDEISALKDMYDWMRGRAA